VEFVPAPNELLAMQQGEIDAASLGAGAVVDNGTPDEALAPFKNDRYGTLTAPGQVGRALHFNMKLGFPFSDVRFRQAVAYTVDRPDLVKRIMLGRGEVGNLGVVEPSNSPFFAKDTATYPLDLTKAKATP
jgi:peptide/nickel transport system substrate-binding protein